MRNLTRLAIPAALGVVAGLLNFVAMKQPVYEYVSIREPLSAGERFPDEANTSDADSPYVRITVNKTIPGAILWTDRGVLHSGIVPRNLEKDDVLLKRDITTSAPRLELGPKEVAINISLEGVRYETSLLRVGSQVGFAVRGNGLPDENSTTSEKSPQIRVSYEVLGPFRIVSLADHVRDTTSYGDNSLSQSNSGSTLSVARPLGENKQLDADCSRLIEANRTQAIGAVIVYSDKQ